MSFLSPLAFLFALSLPAVVVFYLLKRKRVVKLVPSTLLWQKFLAETQASAPWAPGHSLDRGLATVLKVKLFLVTAGPSRHSTWPGLSAWR